MQSHTLKFDSYNLKYYTHGNSENPPLIMIHGYTSSHMVWRQTIPALQDDFYCVSIDLLGHGESDVLPEGDYSIEAQGKRVLAIADHLGFERFSLIGHSMGGQISMCIASALAPERVEKLVNVDGVAAAKLTPFVEKNTLRYIKLMHGTPLAIIFENFYRFSTPRLKPVAAYQLASWFYDMKAQLDQFDTWRIDREYANRKGIRYVWWHCMNAIYDYDLRPHLQKIQAETLTIFGDKDNVVPVTDGQAVKECLPDSQLVWIEDCGHFPMFEQTDAYLKALTDFLVA